MQQLQQLKTQELSDETMHKIEKRWIGYLVVCMQKRMLVTIVDMEKKTHDVNAPIKNRKFDLEQGIQYSKQKLQAYLSCKEKEIIDPRIQEKSHPIKQELLRDRMRSIADLRQGI